MIGDDMASGRRRSATLVAATAFLVAPILMWSLYTPLSACITAPPFRLPPVFLLLLAYERGDRTVIPALAAMSPYRWA